MIQHNLDSKIKRIHNKFKVLTPQVISAVNTIVSTLWSTNKAGSLQIILGKTGSGGSTAIQMCHKRLRHKFNNIVVLRSSPLNEEFNPWKLLLQYYGLYFDESDLKVKTTDIPRVVIDLIERAAIDCIICEDFSEGLDKPTDKQQAIQAWLGVARHSACVNVIISTHDSTYATRFANEGSVTIHQIDEWDNDCKFSLYISDLQEILQTKFKIMVNLSISTTQLYKHCNGNTGNLLNLVREYAVAELLPSNANTDLTEHLPLKTKVRQNAISFAFKPSR